MQIYSPAYTACHDSRAKRWIFDLDNDFLYGLKDKVHTDNVEEIVNLIYDDIIRVMELNSQKTSGVAWINRTKNGFHIITSRFDKRKLHFTEILSDDVFKDDNCTILYA